MEAHMAMPLSSVVSPTARGAIRNARLDETELASWPTVDESQISNADDLARYRRLARAMESYSQGRSMDKVLEQAKVSSRRFFKLLERCRSTAADGQPFGLRALVGRSCISTPVRRTERKDNPKQKETAGYGGLFGKLLREHPDIEQELVQRLRRKGRHRLAPNTLNFRFVHRMFIDICKAELREDEYPLNTRSQGRAPLRRWLKKDFMSRHAVAWMAAESGPDAAQVASYSQGSGQDTAALPIYKAWQIDEQTVNVLARYDMVGESGEVESLDTERYQVIRVV